MLRQSPHGVGFELLSEQIRFFSEGLSFLAMPKSLSHEIFHLFVA